MKALEEQLALEIEKPDQPIPFRTAGVILKMLGREDEARGEFHKAIAVDEFRLAHAHRDEERFAALKSMGETYFDLGDYGSAVGRFEEAYGTTLDRRNRLHIQTWLGRANQAALLEEQRTR